MIKEGRKPSMDPAQEKLRQAKAAWNKDVSAFLNDVIHVKKLMNGWPSKFNKERSKIGDPMPADPTTILGSLAGDFQELAQRGNSIVQQQAQYARTRRRAQPKQVSPVSSENPTIPTAPEETPKPQSQDLSKQLALGLAADEMEAKYGLYAEGSNPFSRFMARLKTPQVGFGAKAQQRRMRMDMLKASLRTYRSLGRFQVSITKSSKESITEAYKHMQEAWNQWSIVSRNFTAIVNSLPSEEKPVKTPPEMTDHPQGGDQVDQRDERQNESDLSSIQKEIAKNIITDVYQNAGLFGNDTTELQAAVKVFEKGPHTLAALNELTKVYTKTISKLNLTPGISGRSLREIASSLTKNQSKNTPIPPIVEVKEANAIDQMETVAQAFVQKWLGKTRHQILPGRSSGLRIQLFDLTTEMRKNINSTMDSLEKGFDMMDLGIKISEVTTSINRARSLMRSLHSTEKPIKGKSDGFLGEIF